MVPRAAAVLVLATVAAVTQAQGPPVYKCVDAAGRTTYQQEPCAKNLKGTPVELMPDNGLTQEPAALEAQWAAAAKVGQVMAGMPKRHVRSAMGTPTEVRAGTAAERASEIWIYRNPGGGRRIGFLDGRVVWERGDDASSEPPAADEAADTAARREAKP